MKMKTNTKLKMGLIQVGIFTLSSLAQMAIALETKPKSFRVTKGTFSGSVANLSAVDAKNLKLYTTTKGNLSVDFTFSAADLANGLNLSAAFKQNTAADTFSFKVLDSNQSYISIGQATGSAGSLKNLNYSIPNSAVINGLIQVRMTSSVNSDDVLFDKLVIADQATTPVPTPSPVVITPTPVPTPTPTPTPQPSVTGSMPVGTSWYWQLQGSLNMGVNAKAYDIDLYDTSAATIAALKADGHTVVCYFSAGSYEDWRSDASQFLASSLGKALDGWPGEKWADIRTQNVRDIMSKRLDLAVSKGCQSVEPDNVDGYANANGLGLTMQDQVNYLSYLSDQAHARGLTIALKNATDLVTQLVDKFDYAVVEECFKYNECSAYTPFIQKGKAVFNAEYTNYSAATCAKAQSLKFSTVFFNLDLNGNVYSPCLPQ